MAKWEIIEDNKFKKQTGGKAAASRTVPAKRTAVEAAASPNGLTIKTPFSNLTPTQPVQKKSVIKSIPTTVKPQYKSEGDYLNKVYGEDSEVQLPGQSSVLRASQDTKPAYDVAKKDYASYKKDVEEQKTDEQVGKFLKDNPIPKTNKEKADYIKKLSPYDRQLIQSSSLSNEFLPAFRQYDNQIGEDAKKYTTADLLNDPTRFSEVAKAGLNRFRFFPNATNSYEDLINPGLWFGKMEQGVGDIPKNIKEENYLAATMGVVNPLLMGRVAGSGSINPLGKSFWTNEVSNAQFINNLVNPLAGTSELIDNLGNRYLPNVSKISPWKFKENPNAYYRQVFGENIENPLITRSMLKNNDPKGMNAFINAQEEKFVTPANESFEYLRFPTTESLPYFNKGKIYFDKNYTKNIKEPELLIESKIPFKDYEDFYPSATNYTSVNPEQASHALKMSGDIRVLNPFSKEGHVLENYNLYEPHWLKGYKKISKPNIGYTGAKALIYKSLQGLGAKPILQQQKNGGIIEDPMGQWAHPGKITQIPSNQITMQGVNYPVLGVSDRGHTQMMYPGLNYSFKGNSVTEYPMMQSGGRYIPESVQPQPSKNYTGTFLPINRDPYGNARKKLFDNENKNPSTESVIGINDDSGYYNIPTVINGVRFSDENAVNNFYNNGMYHTGHFNTQEEADKYADSRERANIGLFSTGLYKYGGEVNFTYAGENHKVYKKVSPTGNGKGIEGHIMVNHPTEDKGKWDTIDLTKITNGKVKTVAQGVASTKKWHKENPEYADGGQVSNWEIIEDLPKAQNGRFTNPPIYVNDPNDPRLGMYNDSLNLYKAYQFQKNHSERNDSDYSAARDSRNKVEKSKDLNYYNNILEANKLNFKSFADYKKASDDFNNFVTKPNWYNLIKTEPYKSKYAWTDQAAAFKNTEDFKKLGIKSDYDKIKYYESLNFSHPEDVAIGRFSSADIGYKRIKPIGSYWGGKGFNPIYAAPKQPYILGSAPFSTPSIHSPGTVSYLTPTFKTIPNLAQKQQDEIIPFNKMGLENLDSLQFMQKVPEPNPITSVPKDYVTITTGSNYRNPETGAFEQKTFKIDKITGERISEPVFKTNNIKIVPGGYKNGGKTKKSNWQIIEY